MAINYREEAMQTKPDPFQALIARLASPEDERRLQMLHERRYEQPKSKGHTR